MNTDTTTKTISAILLCCLVAACGGGSGGGPNLPPLPPSTPPVSQLPTGDLIVFGPMPASGTFKVADVPFAAAGAQVMYNDRADALSSIRPGHIVGMNDFVDAARNVTAEELFFDANLNGNVDSVDVAAGSLVVMGQTIEIDDASILSTPLGDFTRGEVVQVSGYTNDNGVTVASRIDYSVSNRELRLIGRVESLDSANFQFRINNLDVDYSQAQMIDTPNGEVSAVRLAFADDYMALSVSLQRVYSFSVDPFSFQSKEIVAIRSAISDQPVPRATAFAVPC